MKKGGIGICADTAQSRLQRKQPLSG